MTKQERVYPAANPSNTGATIDLFLSTECLYVSLGQSGFLLGAIALWVKGSVNPRVWQTLSGLLGIISNLHLVTS